MDNVEDPVSERVQRLETQVRALHAEMMAMRTWATQLTGRAQAAAAPVARPAEVRVPAPVLSPAVPVQVAPPVLAAAARPREKGSLENQIGSKILSKVAVVLLLIGAALFLKWAFDNRWIGAAGRVAIGLVAGAAIVVWSERFRKQNVASFSYALKAVGSGVLYLSLWASFQLYHLVPGWLAFVAMVGVTAWNAYMAWAQDSQLLAGYALLGAYLTPVLLSTGGDHEVFLFSYLLMIAAGVLALLRSKPWGILLLVALPATAGFFGAWFVEYGRIANTGETVVFALLLWAVFAAVPMVARDEASPIAGVIVPLAAAVFGGLAVYFVLWNGDARAWEPWAAVGFAAVYLALARVSGRSVVSAIHLSLGIVFLTVAIPLKASGRGILLGWMVEAVALLAVSTMESVDGTAKRVLRTLGSIALLLGVLGALVQPLWIEAGGRVFGDHIFMMQMGAALSLVAAIVLGRRMKESATGKMEGQGLMVGAYLLLNIVLIVTMGRQINLYFGQQQTPGEWSGGHALADFAFSGWLMVLGAANLTLGFWKRLALARWTGLILLMVTILKAFAYDMRGLSSGYRVVSYLSLGVLLMAVSFAYQRDWLGLRDLTAQPAEEPDSEVHG